MDNTVKVKSTTLKDLRCPLTPYQLFSPVSTIFLDNMTYEEQLLGLYKQYNNLVPVINNIITELSSQKEIIEKFPEQITELQTTLEQLRDFTQEQLKLAYNAIQTGDYTTLNTAITYINNKINELFQYGVGQEIIDPTTGSRTSLPTALYNIYNALRYFALTAQEYDDLLLTANAYDNYELTSLQYDVEGKWYLSPKPWATRQDLLISGTNIKTINNQSILGSGNIEIAGGITDFKTINNQSITGDGNIEVQDTLISGSNIKTINNESILGSGNINISSSGLTETETRIKRSTYNSVLFNGNSIKAMYIAQILQPFNDTDKVYNITARGKVLNFGTDNPDSYIYVPPVIMPKPSVNPSRFLPIIGTVNIVLTDYSETVIYAAYTVPALITWTQTSQQLTLNAAIDQTTASNIRNQAVSNNYSLCYSISFNEVYY